MQATKPRVRIYRQYFHFYFTLFLPCQEMLMLHDETKFGIAWKPV